MKKPAKPGWNTYPEHIPPEQYGFHKTDVGDLYWENGVWTEPVEWNGWNPPSEQPKLFYVVPEFIADEMDKLL